VKWKIDKDVKIPAQYSKNSHWRELIADMEEGDSVGDLTQNQANGLSALMRKNGINAVGRKMVDKVGVVDTEPIYRVWHNGPKADERGLRRSGSPTDTQGIDPGVLQQAEAHEDKHNIVEDTKEVFKKINEELLVIAKRKKGKA